MWEERRSPTISLHNFSDFAQLGRNVWEKRRRATVSLHFSGWRCSGEGGGEVRNKGGDLGDMGVFVHRMAATIEDDEPGLGHLALEVLP
jgi:hypothetical protein